MEFSLSPLWISLKTALTATGITLIIGTALARWMVFGCRRSERFRDIVDALVILPMVLPPTVVGFLLLLLLGKNGILGQMLYQQGITIVFSWPATVITATIVAVPLMYRTARAAFEQIDHQAIDAAKVLGAADWEIFWRVILPVSLPGIGAGIILSFARALGEFGATIMLAGNIPGKTQTIPLAIYLAVESGEMNNAYLWVGIVLCISVSAIVVMNYWTRKQAGFSKNTMGI